MQVFRNARGYAPTPIELHHAVAPCLAVGGHLKNSIVISFGSQAFLSQHIGDLDTNLAARTQKIVTDTLGSLYDFMPRCVAHDMHPDYQSTRFAHSFGIPEIAVQHHHAHVLAGMADNGITEPVLGISWDGTGWGPDGTIWGGEFLNVDGADYTRIAHLKTFSLPGGEAAVKEPRRSAVGLLFEIFGESLNSLSHLAPIQAFSSDEFRIIGRMLQRRLNSPRTSSAGRLFDAIASLLGLCHVTRHEGHAAILLEFAIGDHSTNEAYPYVLDRTGKTVIIDWVPMIRDIIKDMERRTTTPAIAAKFHNCLVSIILDIARISGRTKVMLTGGCFQNRYLTERAVMVLSREGFQPYIHRRIPPNDGGLAVGQLIAASYSFPERS
jgi:hydrogenase maturation protein HypF